MESVAHVFHQIVCITVDRATQSLHGWTELHVRTPPAHSPFVCLHSLCLSIDRVEVDGRPVEYELKQFPGIDASAVPVPADGIQEPADSLCQELRQTGLACPDPLGLPQSQLYYHYLEGVKGELEPELTVHLPHLFQDTCNNTPHPHTPIPPTGPSPPPALNLSTPKPDPAFSTPPPAPHPGPHTPPPQTPASQPFAPTPPPAPTIPIRIYYHKPAPDATTLFQPPYFAVDPSLRRTRAWVPCADTPISCSTYDLSISTPNPSDWVACSGRLKRQTLTPAQPPSTEGTRTFYYDVASPVPPSAVIFACGPFSVLPDIQEPPPPPPPADAPSGAPAKPPPPDPGVVITHFCPHDLAPLVQWTARHFHLAAAVMSSYLSCRYLCPFLQVVWLPPGMLAEPFLWGYGCLLMSSELLVSERQVEEQVEAAAAAARAVASQWFGVLLLPSGAQQGWLLEGLAGHMEGVYLRGLVGGNEVAWRRAKERDAVVAADDGDAPPLAPEQDQLASTGTLHGRLYGTEVLERSPLRRYKATAVVGMVERKCGEEILQKQLALTAHHAHKDQTNGMLQASTRSTFTPVAAMRAISCRGWMAGMWKGIGEAGSSKERDAFMLRWIQGRGCPSISAAQRYDRKKAALLVAVRQSGGPACRRSFLQAARLVTAHELRIVVHEAGSQAPTETTASLTPDDAYKLVELKMNPRNLGKRVVKKKGGEGDEGAVAGAEEPPGRSPVMWVGVDPHGEWLAHCRVLQPERCAANMLERSKEAAAQSAAIEALVASGRVTDLGRNALAAALVDGRTFCRVRCEAAAALARLAPAADTSPELEALLKAAEEPKCGLREGGGGAWRPTSGRTYPSTWWPSPSPSRCRRCGTTRAAPRRGRCRCCWRLWR